MEEELLKDLIGNISEQLEYYVKMKHDDPNEYNKGLVEGMYYVADSLRNAITIQNINNDENKYEDFLQLVDKIEKEEILNNK